MEKTPIEAKRAQRQLVPFEEVSQFGSQRRRRPDRPKRSAKFITFLVWLVAALCAVAGVFFWLVGAP